MMGGWKSERIKKILISLIFVWLEMEKWRNGKKWVCIKYSYTFLKNGVQLKKRKKRTRQCSNWNLIKKKSKVQRPCASAHGLFCYLIIIHSPLSFLLVLKRKLFGGLEEKTPGSHYYFPLFPSQWNTLQNVPPIFFSIFFLSSLKSTLHQTHPKGGSDTMITMVPKNVFAL